MKCRRATHANVAPNVDTTYHIPSFAIWAESMNYCIHTAGMSSILTLTSIRYYHAYAPLSIGFGTIFAYI